MEETLVMLSAELLGKDWPLASNLLGPWKKVGGCGLF
jgi:hypothetical protein